MECPSTTGEVCAPVASHAATKGRTRLIDGRNMMLGDGRLSLALRQAAAGRATLKASSRPITAQRQKIEWKGLGRCLSGKGGGGGA